MSALGRLGERAAASVQGLNHLLAVAAAAVGAASRPRQWSPPVRNVLARQILFTGYEATPFIALVAFLVGISIVVQAQVWLTAVGQKGLIGPILVMVVIRELGPLLTNFVVIGRSGTAMATEMANMKLSGEVHALDALGLDPLLYLVMPRVIGAAVSVFCLTVIFVLVSFVSGFLSSMLFGGNAGGLGVFVDSISGAIRPRDVFNLLAKSFVPGLLTGTICCIQGLAVESAITEVPQAATRAVVYSTAALFISCAIVSLMTYL